MFDDGIKGERAFVNIRLYEDFNLAMTPEISVILFQVPVSKEGKEVVLRITSFEIHNKGVFYTD